MLGIHAVRDPNAPYLLGDVVVPTTPPSIVIPWAAGAGYNIERANFFNNNASFANKIYPDPITAAVEARYGTSVAFNGDQIAVGTGKGLLPFILTEAAAYPLNHGSPWQFWSATQPTAMATVPTSNPPVSAHTASSQSNPFMAQSDLVGRNTAMSYIDTIQKYINPRMVCALGLAECDLYETVGINTVSNNAYFTAFPNPANDFVTIRTNADVQGIKSVRMFDMTGREVRQLTKLNTTSIQVNRDNLPAGIYLVQVETTQGNSQIKVIFE
jgi:hypothetical protein